MTCEWPEEVTAKVKKHSGKPKRTSDKNEDLTGNAKTELPGLERRLEVNNYKDYRKCSGSFFF